MVAVLFWFDWRLGLEVRQHIARSAHFATDADLVERSTGVMLPTYFLAAAMALRLAGEARYFVAVVRGRVHPNPVSWFCWGLAPLVAFAAQMSNGLRPTEWMTLVLALGPIAVVTAAVVKGGIRSRLNRFDLACGASALVGLVAWQVTNRPAVALLFSILADLIAAMPTLRNAYRRPFDEYAPTYLMSSVAMAITLLTVHHWRPGIVALPLYTLAVNAALYAVIKIRTAVPAPHVSTLDGNRVGALTGAVDG